MSSPVTSSPKLETWSATPPLSPTSSSKSPLHLRLPLNILWQPPIRQTEIVGNKSDTPLRQIVKLTRPQTTETKALAQIRALLNQAKLCDVNPLQYITDALSQIDLLVNGNEIQVTRLLIDFSKVNATALWAAFQRIQNLKLPIPGVAYELLINAYAKEESDRAYKKIYEIFQYLRSQNAILRPTVVSIFLNYFGKLADRTENIDPVILTGLLEAVKAARTVQEPGMLDVINLHKIYHRVEEKTREQFKAFNIYIQGLKATGILVDKTMRQVVEAINEDLLLEDFDSLAIQDAAVEEVIKKGKAAHAPVAALADWEEEAPLQPANSLGALACASASSSDLSAGCAAQSSSVKRKSIEGK